MFAVFGFPPLLLLQQFLGLVGEVGHHVLVGDGECGVAPLEGAYVVDGVMKAHAIFHQIGWESGHRHQRQSPQEGTERPLLRLPVSLQPL